MKGWLGFGKFVIIIYIVFKYLDKGWIVKFVKMVDEMIKICYMEKWLMYIVLFVFDVFIGKYFLNDELINILK